MGDGRRCRTGPSLIPQDRPPIFTPKVLGIAVEKLIGHIERARRCIAAAELRPHVADHTIDSGAWPYTPPTGPTPEGPLCTQGKSLSEGRSRFGTCVAELEIVRQRGDSTNDALATAAVDFGNCDVTLGWAGLAGCWRSRRPSSGSSSASWPVRKRIRAVIDCTVSTVTRGSTVRLLSSLRALVRMTRTLRGSRAGARIPSRSPRARGLLWCSLASALRAARIVSGRSYFAPRARLRLPDLGDVLAGLSQHVGQSGGEAFGPL